MKKTVKIIDIIEKVNAINANTFDSDKGYREGQSALLECILHDAGCYCGLTYLSANDLGENAQSVGIREQRADGTWNFKDTDRTRVKYYIHYKL